MPYEPGGDCNVIKGSRSEQNCDGCFPSKAVSPIVVKITRPINSNAGRMGYGGRGPSSRGDCCKLCNHKQNANQMVFNQNRIVNFDLINHINNASGLTPNLTYTSTPPGGPPAKRKCDNCINILRDKELQLLKKEQEILKIKTHFTNLPKKGGAQVGLGANCEQCFKALREKEFELFRKDQEIAKMKRAAALKSPFDTQTRAERARCTNCFKALRQKEIELIKKEHALMKNMTRPNINVKNLNFCSCCRDKNKSSVNQMRKQEELRRKNRDNCFKQIRMKEIRLLAKEREIEKKIQKFREESLAKAKLDLDKTPDPRLIKPTTKEVIKCVCSCTGMKGYKESQQNRKGVCAFFYRKFPKATGGWAGPSKVTISEGGQMLKARPPLSAKQLKDLKCTRPCCVMKIAADLASYALSPPKAKKPKQLPEACRFMKMLAWCSPDQPQDVVKCCIIPSEPDEKLTVEEQKTMGKRIKAQKAMAIKAAKAAAASSSDYKVDTIGRIRPRWKQPSSEKIKNLTPWEAEVFRSYGHKGLKAYKAKMAELRVDTEIAQAKIPRRITSRGTYEAIKLPTRYTAKQKAFRRSKASKQLIQESGDDFEPGVPIKPTFKIKAYNRAARAAKKFKVKSGRDYVVDNDTRSKVEKYGSGAKKSKTMFSDISVVSRKSKVYTTDDDGRSTVSKKSKATADKERGEVPKEYKKMAIKYEKMKERGEEMPTKYKKFARTYDKMREEGGDSPKEDSRGSPSMYKKMTRKFGKIRVEEEDSPKFEKMKEGGGDLPKGSKEDSRGSPIMYKKMTRKFGKIRVEEEDSPKFEKMKEGGGDLPKGRGFPKMYKKMTRKFGKVSEKGEDLPKEMAVKYEKDREGGGESPKGYKKIARRFGKIRVEAEDSPKEMARKFEKVKEEEEDLPEGYKKMGRKFGKMRLDGGDSSKEYKKNAQKFKTMKEESEDFPKESKQKYKTMTRKFAKVRDKGGELPKEHKILARKFEDMREDEGEMPKKYKKWSRKYENTRKEGRDLPSEYKKMARKPETMSEESEGEAGKLPKRYKKVARHLAKMREVEGHLPEKYEKMASHFEKIREEGGDLPKKYKKRARKYEKIIEEEGELPKKYNKMTKKYDRMEEEEEERPRKFKKMLGTGWREEEQDIPERYRATVRGGDYDYSRSPSRYGSGDYGGGYATDPVERVKEQISHYTYQYPACRKYFKVFGKSLIYCAGCFVGIPCILFLCLCFLLTSCSD